MDLQLSIQFFVAINLFIIGLSHLVQPKIWVDFFQVLHNKGNTGNLFNGMLSLGMGSFVVSFHFIFRGAMVLVTIYGILLLLKGLIYLIFPSVGLKRIGKAKEKNKFVWAGILMLLLSLFIGYHILINL